MNNLIGIGFWYDDPMDRIREQFKHFDKFSYRRVIEKYRRKYKDAMIIRPSDLATIRDWYKDKDKQRIIDYLDSGKTLSSYFGRSECRICKQHLGSSDLSDGVYLWPEKFSHYIKEHEIILPDWFIEHIKKNEYKIPEFEQTQSGNYNEKKWIDWYCCSRRKGK